jgi:hypothetical protein
MSIGGILLGLINIGIVIVLLVLVGVIGKWILGWLGVALPAQAEKLYLILVALIALAMLVALVLGVGPTWRIVESPPGPFRIA